MKPIEEAFYQLLNQYIQFDDEPVPILLGYPEVDSTPCITISTADETFQKRRYVEIYNEQYIQKRFQLDLWINVWANNNKQRHKLVQQVNKRILQAEANHYSACTNYNLHGQGCNVTGHTCEAIYKNKHRPHKNQCPNLENYSPFFKHHHIIKNTFYVDGVTDLDELEPHDPVLRTIIKLKLNYYTYFKIGGDVYEDFSINHLL